MDERHQDQHGDFGWKWRWRKILQGDVPALVFRDMRIRRKIHMGSSYFLPLKFSLSAEVNEDRVATTAEFLSQHLRRHAGRTPRGQRYERVGETAGLGESDVAVKPEPVSSESRDRMEGVPFPIVRETAVVSPLSQKATDGRNGVVHFACKRVDHPAWLFCEQRDEVLLCLLRRNHMHPLIKYSIYIQKPTFRALLYHGHAGLARLYFEWTNQYHNNLFLLTSTC